MLALDQMQDEAPQIGAGGQQNSEVIQPGVLWTDGGGLRFLVQFQQRRVGAQPRPAVAASSTRRPMVS